jgi:hypothetical protein
MHLLCKFYLYSSNYAFLPFTQKLKLVEISILLACVSRTIAIKVTHNQRHLFNCFIYFINQRVFNIDKVKSRLHLGKSFNKNGEHFFDHLLQDDLPTIQAISRLFLQSP